MILSTSCFYLEGAVIVTSPWTSQLRSHHLKTISLDPLYTNNPTTPVGINEKGFVNSNFGMFLLLDYCIENERESVGMQLCRVLINISFKSSKIVYFSQNCYFHVMQCVCYQIDDVVVVHSLLRLCDFSFSGKLAEREIHVNGKKMDINFLYYMSGCFFCHIKVHYY